LPLTGAAALHVLLMRVSHAQDAYGVFGWHPHSVYTHAELRLLLDESVRVLRAFDHRVHPASVLRVLFSFVLGAYARVNWAMPIVYDRLDVMDDQSAGETDTDA
jgi:hypothetical protein